MFCFIMWHMQNKYLMVFPFVKSPKCHIQNHAFSIFMKLISQEMDCDHTLVVLYNADIILVMVSSTLKDWYPSQVLHQHYIQQLRCDHNPFPGKLVNDYPVIQSFRSNSLWQTGVVDSSSLHNYGSRMWTLDIFMVVLNLKITPIRVFQWEVGPGL